MSRFFSSRSRFSDPEKPEPRFQWRMRVNSLMMDDGNNPTDDRNLVPVQDGTRRKPDSDGDTLGASSRDSAESNLKSSDSSRSSTRPISLAIRERRERFSRTKSEGQLKLRVKFSRTVKEDDEDSSDASPEFTRRRTLPTRSKTLREDELPSRAERRYRRYQTGSSSEAGAAADLEKKEMGRSTESINDFSVDCVKDASRGAIPKHIREGQRPPGSDDSTSSDENIFRNRRRRAKSSSPDSAIGESLPNTQAVSRDRSPSMTEPDKVYASGVSEGEEGQSSQQLRGFAEFDSSDDFLPPQAQEVQLEGRAIAAGSSTHTEQHDTDRDQHGGATGCDGAVFESSSARARPARPPVSSEEDGGSDGEADDIESIIEQIIAAEELEEQGGGGLSPANSSLVDRVADFIGPADARRFEGEMQQLQETIADCNRETEADLRMSRHGKDFDSQRSSSVPSNGPDDENNTTTIIPYSSSYPSAKNRLFRKMQGKYSSDEDDAKEADDREADDIDASWANLPMILMEDVLTLLTPKERHLASQVCRQWYDLFYSPRVWETFILLERTLTKKRFNLYKGYQRELCPGKTQLCFRRVGSYFKRIVVTPITDYFNLYEFLRILAAFLQSREDHGASAMPLLHTFDFTFACATRGYAGIIIHGTGGQILEMIKELLTRMKDSLRHMKLNQLLLEASEMPSLFGALVECFSECLHSLEMLNVTKVPFPLPELASFRSLVKLVVSPQHLSEETVLLLSGLNLLQLHIIQDPYTCECDPVSAEAWKAVREVAPWLRVYLEVTGNTKARLLVQPRAPVYGVFLRSPHGGLSHTLLMAVVENYGQLLRYFVQERLPRTHGPRGFEHRCDSALLYLVRRCPRLHTLVVRERISTATLLLLATEGRSLTTLLVRQNALIKRCDWPQRGEFPIEFYARLREAALDYQKCTDEICSTLRSRWRPMSDMQFKQLKIVPRLEMC